MYVVALFYFSDLNVFWCVYNGLRALPLSRIRMGNCEVNLVGLGVNVEKEFSYPLVIKDASMIIINSIPKGYIGALDQD